MKFIPASAAYINFIYTCLCRIEVVIYSLNVRLLLSFALSLCLTCYLPWFLEFRM
ncbi:hypothetical protein YC2023_031475 [Brassica napus]